MTYTSPGKPWPCLGSGWGWLDFFSKGAGNPLLGFEASSSSLFFLVQRNRKSLFIPPGLAVLLGNGTCAIRQPPKAWGQRSVGLFLHPSRNICVQNSSWSAAANSRFIGPGPAPSLEAAPRHGLHLEKRCSKNIKWGFKGSSSGALQHTDLVTGSQNLGLLEGCPQNS